MCRSRELITNIKERKLLEIKQSKFGLDEATETELLRMLIEFNKSK